MTVQGIRRAATSATKRAHKYDAALELGMSVGMHRVQTEGILDMVCSLGWRSGDRYRWFAPCDLARDLPGRWRRALEYVTRGYSISTRIYNTLRMYSLVEFAPRGHGGGCRMNVVLGLLERAASRCPMVASPATARAP